MNCFYSKGITSFVRRLAAGFTAAALLFPAGPAALSASRETAPHNALNSGRLIEESLLSFPSAAGRVLDVHRGAGNRLWILIQDAHALPEAQDKIRAAVEYFTERGVHTVGIEGADSPLDPVFFRSFPDTELLRETLKSYGEKGELAAATAAAILGKEDVFFSGVEDWPLYLEGLGAYQKAALDSGARALAARKAAELRVEKEEKYPPVLLKLDLAETAFHEERISLIELLEEYSAVRMPTEGTGPALLIKETRGEAKTREALELELRREGALLSERLKTADAEEAALVPDYQRHFQQFLTSQSGMKEFAGRLFEAREKLGLPPPENAKIKTAASEYRMIRDLEGSRLFEELEEYLIETKAPLLVSDELKRIDEESSVLRALLKLSSLEMTEDDWKKACGYFERRPGSGLQELWRSLAPHRAFYENAVKRDGAMFENMGALLETRRTEAGILIAGGFHAGGLTKLVKEAGDSYLLIAPHVSELPEINLYRGQMFGEVSWQSYLRAENGKVDLPGAFTKALRDALAERADEAQRGRLLKEWRDRIIRDLAASGRIIESGRYTRLIDEMTDDAPRLPEWRQNLQGYIGALRRLEAAGRFDSKNIVNLLQAQTYGVPWIQSAIASRGWVSEDALRSPFSAGVRSELRAEDNGDARSKIDTEDLYRKLTGALSSVSRDSLRKRGYDLEVRPALPDGIYLNLFPEDGEKRKRLESVDTAAGLRKIEVPFGAVGHMRIYLIEARGEPALFIYGMQSSYSYRKLVSDDPGAVNAYKNWTHEAVEALIEAAEKTGLKSVYAKTPEMAEWQHIEIGSGRARRYYLLPFRTLFRKVPTAFRRLDLSWDEVREIQEIERRNTGRALGRAGGEFPLWHYHRNIWINPAKNATNPHLLSKRHFREASRILTPHIKKTPLIEAERLSRLTGKRVFVKDEALQKGGSFKTRGVMYEVYAAISEVLNDKENGREILKNGLKIVTQSTGNHGIAMIRSVAVLASSLAEHYDETDPELAGYIRRIEPVVFTFKDLSPVKRRDMIAALETYRKYVNPELGLINDQFDDYDKAREERVRFIEFHGKQARYQEHGGRDIMLGHGTAGIEIAEQLLEAGVSEDEPTVLIIPVGAGGPLGIAAALKAYRPKNTYAVMVQSDRWDAFVRTLQTGKMQKNPDGIPPTAVVLAPDGTTTNIIFPDGIAVDGAEPAAVPIAEAYLDAAVSVDELAAYNGSGPLLLADLNSAHGNTETPVGGTSALTAEAILSFLNKLEVFRRAKNVVLFATEGNVAEPVLEHLRANSLRAEEIEAAYSQEIDAGTTAAFSRSELRETGYEADMPKEAERFLARYEGEVYYPAAHLDMESVRTIAKMFPKVKQIVMSDKLDDSEKVVLELRHGPRDKVIVQMKRELQTMIPVEYESFTVEPDPLKENEIRIRIKFSAGVPETWLRGREFEIRYILADLFEVDETFGAVYVQGPGLGGRLSEERGFWKQMARHRARYIAVSTDMTRQPDQPELFSPQGRITYRSPYDTSSFTVHLYRPAVNRSELRAYSAGAEFNPGPSQAGTESRDIKYLMNPETLRELENFDGPLYLPGQVFNPGTLKRLLAALPRLKSAVYTDSLTYGPDSTRVMQRLDSGLPNAFSSEYVLQKLQDTFNAGLNLYEHSVDPVPGRKGAFDIAVRFKPDLEDKALAGREIRIRYIYGRIHDLRQRFDGVYIEGLPPLRTPHPEHAFWKHIERRAKGFVLVNRSGISAPRGFEFAVNGLLSYSNGKRERGHWFVLKNRETRNRTITGKAAAANGRQGFNGRSELRAGADAPAPQSARKIDPASNEVGRKSDSEEDLQNLRSSELRKAALTFIEKARKVPVSAERLKETARAAVRAGVGPLIEELEALETEILTEESRGIEREISKIKNELASLPRDFYTVAYALPSDLNETDVRDFTEAVLRFGWIREVIVPRGVKVPEAFEELRRSGIRIRSDRLARKHIEFSGPQKAAGLVVPSADGVSFEASEKFIPVLIETSGQADTLSSRLATALQTAVAVLLAHEAEAGGKGGLLKPAALLKKYGIFSSFEDQVVRREGNQWIVSASGIKAYLEWSAAQAIGRSA